MAALETLHDLPVLIVDDNDTNRLICQELINNWGMKSTSAASGREAIAAMQRASDSGQPFRLVLLDVMMPGMDGFDTLKRMHETPHFDNATVIMLSSAGRSEDRRRRRVGRRSLPDKTRHAIATFQLDFAVARHGRVRVAAVRFDARPTAAILYRGGFC